MPKPAPNLLNALSLEQVLRTVPSGLFLVDLDQHIVYWNAEAERITGYSETDAIGKHCSFLAGIPCGKGCGLYNKTVPKPIIGVACSVKTRGGRRITLLKNVDYLKNDQGEIVGGVESFTEITKQVRLEKELRQHTAELETTVQKRTAELEAERSSLRNVLDGMADFAYICSADYRVRFMNRAMTEAFGPQVGKICFQVFYGKASPCEECPMGRILGGETVRQERFYQADGRFYEIIHTPLKAPDGTWQKLAVFRDITDRKKIESELRATKARLEQLLTTNPAVIYTARPGGNYGTTFVSANIRGLLGYEPEEFTENPEFWAEHIHPEDRGRILSDLTHLIQKGHHIHEYRFRHKDGRYRWMRDECRVVRDAQGNTLEVGGYWIDITDRKEAEEKLKESNRDLDTFVHTVSHDLRTPLTPILGYAEFLKDEYGEQLDARARHILDEIEGQGERMLAMIEDLLDLSRVGRVNAPAGPVSADKIVREVLGDLKDLIGKEELGVDVAPLPSVAVSESLLSQVFANLIGNAVRYAGGRGARIEVGGEGTGERIRFFVRDHGPGIPAGERERVFELFYRGTTAGVTRGTGIGLATVRKIARLYGGRVWADETPGGGSTFWVELPVQPG